MGEKCVFFFFFFFSPLCFLSLKVSSFPVRTEVVLGMMHFHPMWGMCLATGAAEGSSPV